MAQDGDIGHSGLQSPSQDQLANIHRQDSNMKISEPRDEAEAPPGKQRLRRMTLERLRGVATLWHCPFPGQHSAIQRGAPRAYGFYSGREKEPKVDIQLPQHCRVLPRRSIWILPHWGHSNSAGLDHWESEAEMVGRVYSNQCSILADHISLCSCALAEILGSGCAYLQSQAGGPVWPWGSVGSWNKRMLINSTKTYECVILTGNSKYIIKAEFSNTVMVACNSFATLV